MEGEGNGEKGTEDEEGKEKRKMGLKKGRRRKREDGEKEWGGRRRGREEMESVGGRGGEWKRRGEWKRGEADKTGMTRRCKELSKHANR